MTAKTIKQSIRTDFTIGVKNSVVILDLQLHIMQVRRRTMYEVNDHAYHSYVLVMTAKGRG